MFGKNNKTQTASIDLTSSLDQALGLREPSFMPLKQNKIGSGMSAVGFL